MSNQACTECTVQILIWRIVKLTTNGDPVAVHTIGMENYEILGTIGEGCAPQRT
eukprot:COSAG04_NODE_21425_length_374_cov_0.560000_1_plen_53_part_01